MANEDIQSEILQRLTRVETKLDMQLNAKDLALEALSSAKAAHKRSDEFKVRYDEMDKHFDNEAKTLNTRVTAEVLAINVRIDNENKERKIGLKWLIGTYITLAGLIVAVVKIF